MRDHQLQLSGGRLSAVAVLATTGLTVSGYLAWQSLASSPVAGCSGDAVLDCASVLKSRWSIFLGTPVSLLAVITYTTMLIALAHVRFAASSQWRGISLGVIRILAAGAGFAALWFIGLQVFALRKLCVYCMAAHMCGLLLAVDAIRSSSINRSYRQFAAAFTGVALLAMTQSLSEPPVRYVFEESTSKDLSESTPELFSPFGDQQLDSQASAEAEPKEQEATSEPENPMNGAQACLHAAGYLLCSSSLAFAGVVTVDETAQATAENNPGRIVSIRSGGIQLRTTEWPILGDPDADRVIVKFFDYTCSHCRATSETIESVRNEADGNLAVLVVPVPLHPSCNDSVRARHPGHQHACELSRIAIAVWLAAPERFAEFHLWLMHETTKRDPATVRQKAIMLVGRKALMDQEDSDHVDAVLKTGVRLYETMGAGPLPKLAFPQTTLVGRVNSPKIIHRLIDKGFQE